MDSGESRRQIDAIDTQIIELFNERMKIVEEISREEAGKGMIAIEEGEADYAVLPIENSTAGVVSQIYDMLAEFENYIVGEKIIRVEHCLMVCEDANRISICIEGAHESGSLYQLLSHIIYNGLNMTKIESRPIEERNWEYRFFIDFDGNLRDPGVRNALRGLRDDARSLRVLGNYRV